MGGGGWWGWGVLKWIPSSTETDISTYKTRNTNNTEYSLFDTCTDAVQTLQQTYIQATLSMSFKSGRKTFECLFVFTRRLCF